MAPGSESELVERLRAGDEAAFTDLVDRYHGQLVRLATGFVRRREVAEDVAQETWLALLTGLDRFEGRSSLRTWLFQVCVNRAKSAGVREQRTVPVEQPERFGPDGGWTDPPVPWTSVADDRLVGLVEEAIGTLSTMQRLVVTMRDVDGFNGRQVSAVLSITEANQRVLLHRGRAHVRAAIDRAVSRS